MFENTKTLNLQKQKEEAIWFQIQISIQRRFFSKNLLAIEMKKTQVIMNKLVYLGLSRLDISKVEMYEFWYDYLKPKYNDKAKMCYINTDSFIVHIKTEDIYNDISEDIETRFDTSNHNVNRLLPMRKSKKVLGLMKDGLGGRIVKRFVG